MSKKTSNKIYYLYFILSIFIIGIHAYNSESFLLNDVIATINHCVIVLFNMAVPTFFLVSAFLFYRNVEQKKYFEVLKNKTFSLLLPYLIWNVLYCPFKILKMIFIDKTEYVFDLWDILKKILLSGWDTPLWFIRVLFIFVLIYPLIKLIIKYTPLYLFVAILNVVITIIVGPKVGYSHCYYWFPVYLTGAYLSSKFKDHVFSDVKQKAYVYVISFILLICLVVGGHYSDYALYFARMLTPFLIWLLADVFLIERNPKWFMRQTFFYFCAHLAVAEIIRNVYVSIFGNGNISAIFSIPILTTAVLLVCVGAAYVLRLIKPVWNLLTGARTK